MTPGVDRSAEPIAVAEVLLRYGSSLDERDWTRLATCFAPDATAVLGVPPVLEGRGAIVEACSVALTAYDKTHHMITMPEVEIDGDAATLRANLIATHVSEHGNFTVGGVYREGLVRTDEGWWILRHELEIVWTA